MKIAIEVKKQGSRQLHYSHWTTYIFAISMLVKNWLYNLYISI